MTAPGIYPDMPNAVYHADEALSSSGMKRLLPPACPATYRYGEREDKDEFDFGHVAHKLVLGEGDAVVIVEAETWQTNVAKAAKKAARAEDKVPILAKYYERAEAMAAKVREHPLASALFSDGRPEVSLFWRDEQTDVPLRVRYDWLPNNERGGRLLLGDYKTTASANPAKFAKSFADYGYHRQAWLYCEAARVVLGAEDPWLMFVAQEKVPPYLITVAYADAESLRVAERECRDAIDTFAKCRADDYWPGYSDEPEPLSLPRWYWRGDDT